MSANAQLTSPHIEDQLADLFTSVDIPSLPSPYPQTQNSLYLTFKVAQLISSFRKRVKTRALSHGPQSNASARKVQTKLCKEFESQAFEEIDKYLGKDRKASRRGYAKTKRSICFTGQAEDDSATHQQTNCIKP